MSWNNPSDCHHRPPGGGQAVTTVTRLRRSGHALALALAGGACCMLPATAAAGGSSFTTKPANIDQVASNTGVAPGDVVSVGFVLAVHGGSNKAATLYVL